MYLCLLAFVLNGMDLFEFGFVNLGFICGFWVDCVGSVCCV